MKKSFKQFLQEAPLGDYKLHGKWDKNSSFRDPRDRMLLQHPSSIKNVEKRFGNSEYLWNLHFVNSAKANKHTEVGEVSLEWVSQNLGEDVAKSVEESMNKHEDSINVIFTNNKGSERMNMTAHIMAHRIGHVLRRGKGTPAHLYIEAEKHLLHGVSDIMELYGNTKFNKVNSFDGDYDVKRKQQLTMLYFFYNVATFRSARDKNVRDWFEILNELIAQYITTGHIKFNKAPQCFGNSGGRNRINYCTKEVDEVSEMLETLARDMEYMIDSIFSGSIGSIFVM